MLSGIIIVVIFTINYITSMLAILEPSKPKALKTESEFPDLAWERREKRIH